MLAEAAARGATLEEVERAYIDEVLRLTRGNKTAAARILGIHRKTLHEKLRGAGGGDPES
jgi:DNA-binding protein Fis